MRALIFAALLLAVLASEVQAAWPQARWKRPGFHPEHGDIRGVFEKFQRDERRIDPIADPNPKEEGAGKRRSRSYHFKYGPLFPEHHIHLQETDQLAPPKHKRWNP